jgi:hypothetical protein
MRFEILVSLRLAKVIAFATVVKIEVKEESLSEILS